ncbi:SRPBCC domain-containing protein [Micromonospora sp. NPDC048835]|uniref:SRPBCC family protein n=1 Tax=Micromonospora sp. NPDC048835 TaxID=3155147 RepID=UPI0033F7BD21
MLQEETVTDTATIAVDQFIAAPPSKVWRSLTEPELLARWWVPGDVAAVVGHRFHLQMPAWGAVDCKVTEVEPERRFVHTFNEKWTLTWRLVPEGNGTRLFLDHSGFDLDDPRAQDAFARMGPGWRDKILPGLAQLAADLPD